MPINLRTSRIPFCLILVSPQNAIPNHYLHECRLDNKYATGIPNTCTNPGCCVGATTHTHNTPAGGHGHCGVTGGSGHTHTGTSSASGGDPFGGWQNDWQYAASGHAHQVTSSPTAPNFTTNCSGAHTHNCNSNDPDHKTIRYIRYNPSSLPLRENSMGDATVFWKKNLSCIPSHLTLDGSHFDKFIKQTANQCTNPGTTGGSNNHTHNCQGTHTHTVTGAAHTHGGASIGSATVTGGTNPAPVQGLVPAGHAHPNSASFACSGAFCTTSGGASVQHNHGSDVNDPAYHTLALLSQNNVSIRKGGLIKCGIGMWLEPNSCIPNCFVIADGTNCTPNLLSKYVRVIPDGCTNPGTTGGTNCNHSHSTQGAHTHTVSLGHTHSLSGSLGGTPTFAIGSGYGNAPKAPCGHGHSFSGTSSNFPESSPLNCSVTHCHGGTSARPLSIEVSFIQNI